MTYQIKKGDPIDPEEVFEVVERDRADGTLHETLTAGRITYHSSDQPGCIVQLDRTGPEPVTHTGKWIDGGFVPLNRKNR